ncbi:YhjD/YihY/BrkB family envelope integrity protein [Mycoplasmopsis alligatoris]|uniref:Ribonuclease BN-like family protein n=1 Tax=Mycoplasmopsis alligatoris A21JP2 TaxID=747682 RepID=D4XV58_9BACT|nr:YhjD/YihY/BrkB family envelope integrity protein [Mycoplasmopsis alligatoris]EFF41771.1 ribonuclease BN-like family protein [Mycoplasmopsis alligatoris A21JP2]
MRNSDKSAYKKYYREFAKNEREYKKVLKKRGFFSNIVWPNILKINLYEIIIKFIIKIILYITFFWNFKKNKAKLNAMVNRAYMKFSSREFTFIPAASGFYLLVSFVPIIIISYLILSLLSVASSGNIFNAYFIDIILPKMVPGIETVISFLTLQLRKTEAIISLVFLGLSSLWVSSAGYGKIISSQNYIYNHKYLGTNLGNRLKGLILVVVISLYLSLLIAFTLGLDLLIGGYDVLDKTKNSSSTFILFIFNALIFLYTGFLMLFKFSPSFKLSFRAAHSGVLVASIPTWLLVSLFGFLAKVTDFNKYGPLGIFMYLSIFISWFTYFMYLGIIVNEAYFKTFVSQRTVQKKILFKF